MGGMIRGGKGNATARGFQTPILPFATVLRIHSFAARTFGAKPRPLVISNTHKAIVRRSAEGGCLTSPECGLC
jgi:hypothetical protein